jgi:hypothetical protein
VGWFFSVRNVGHAVTYIGERPGLFESIDRPHGLHVSKGMDGQVVARADYLFRKSTYDVSFDRRRVNGIRVGGTRQPGARVFTMELAA